MRQIFLMTKCMAYVLHVHCVLDVQILPILFLNASHLDIKNTCPSTLNVENVEKFEQLLIFNVDAAHVLHVQTNDICSVVRCIRDVKILHIETNLGGATI